MTAAHPIPHLPAHVPIAATFRGGHPENIYFGSFSVVSASGEVLASAGDIDSAVFTRSALKPFQAMPLIHLGSDRFALEDADIALLCASHSGEPRHTARVAGLLARIGASETALACGMHEPYFFRTMGQTPPAGASYTRLQHNCSGKHTGMLMLAHALGQPLAGYLDAAHQVQQAIRESVAHFSGIAPERLVPGIDGCSAPNYALPLRALAQAFARLTLSSPDPLFGSTPVRVARAMCRHPEMVSGEGRNDLFLMQAGAGDWVSKVGADGVQAVASFSRGVGIAAKVSDGNLTPLMVALVAALQQLGWADAACQQALTALLPPPMKNAAGIEVGVMRSVLQLQHH